MRFCPTCKQGYEDDTLNYCLQDGSPLVSIYPGSEDPTRRLNRSTAETMVLPTSAAADASQVSKPHPETHYAKSGNVNIAFQIVGEGPIDIVYVPGWVSHLEYGWESPLVANFYRRLASFSRLILFDKRGTGLSDQAADLPTLEQRMDDVRAVMEAADSARAVVFGMSEGGNMSLLFAATYPERTIALITFGVFAKRVWDPEYPWAPTAEQRQGFYDAIENEWGSPIGIEDIAPSVAHDQSVRDWWATYQRRSASPSAALALARMNTMIDVSSVLPAIQVPTLLLHRTGDLDVNIAEGRYIAERIPAAKFVELPGIDHLIYAGDQDSVITEVQSFIQSIQQTNHSEDVLATVLYAEILPTSQSEISGDTSKDRERALAMAKRESEWFKATVIQAGAVFVATFDGPVRAVRAAAAIAKATRRAGIDVRAGLHTGLCNIAAEKIGGAAVEISSAVAAVAEAGEVLVTQPVKDLLSGSGVQFDERDALRLDRDLGELKLYAVKPE
jgi:pimeloyl-ACP methyl ester carboxylesterase